MLKCIYRVLQPNSGAIYLDGNALERYTVKETAQKQAVLAQHNYTNFDFEVIDVVLMGRSPYKKVMESDNVEDYNIAYESLRLVGMEHYAHQSFNILSGGEQQRVAIARTLSLKPDIILFDEPMSALDADNKLVLRKELKDIQKEFKTTMIYITHDQEEAFSLSDRVMVMNDGKIEQIDVPNVIFNKPANEYVKNFVTNHLIEKVSSIEKCTGIDL